MSARADSAPAGDAVARRLAAHRREQRAERVWRALVRLTSLSLVSFYLVLLFVARVTEPFYLLVNALAVATGLCNFLVHLAYQLPTILEELPRLSPSERLVNLAAIAPTRAEILGRALPELRLTRSRAQAVALDDEELVRRLAALERPNWRKIGAISFVVWLVLASAAAFGIATYRPEHGVSLVERAQGKTPLIERHWTPKY